MKKEIVLFLFLLPCSIRALLNQNQEKHLVVVSASYNNLSYCVNNLNSILKQSYHNFHVIYVDDNSTDSMSSVVRRFVEINPTLQERFLYIRNHVKKCALANQYRAAHMCRENDVIIILDGDDWLHDPTVFKYLNDVYKDPNVWFTYGQFVQHPTRHRGWCGPIPEKVIQENTFREYTHAPGHLRTFYAGLFQQIKKEDLFYDGDFYRMTGDNAFTFPILEMAGRHHKFISKVLMVYNIGNPLNDHKKVPGLQRQLDIQIRKKQKYHAIETPFYMQGDEHEDTMA